MGRIARSLPPAVFTPLFPPSIRPLGNMNGYMTVMSPKIKCRPRLFLAIREPQILVSRSRGGDYLEDWHGDAVQSKPSSQTVDSFGRNSMPPFTWKSAGHYQAKHTHIKKCVHLQVLNFRFDIGVRIASYIHQFYRSSSKPLF